MAAGRDWTCGSPWNEYSDSDESEPVDQEDDLGVAIETLDDPPVLVGNIGVVGRGPRTGVRRPDRLGRDYIGRGYGMAAMRVIGDYGFREMGLHRIQLSVARFDPAAIRAYQKAGPLRRAAIARVRGLLAGRRVAGAGCPCRACWR